MPYRDHEMTGDVKHRPEEAKAKILDTYRKSGANLLATAENLEVSEPTIHRWIRQLRLRSALKEVKREVAKAGRLLGRRRTS